MISIISAVIAFDIVHFLRLLKPVFVCMSLHSCCTIYTPIPSYQQVKSSAMIDSTCTCKKYQGIVQRFPFVSVCYYDQKHQIEVIKRGIGWPLVFIIMRSIARIRFQFHVRFLLLSTQIFCLRLLKMSMHVF